MLNMGPCEVGGGNMPQYGADQRGPSGAGIRAGAMNRGFSERRSLGNFRWLFSKWRGMARRAPHARTQPSTSLKGA